MSGPDGAVGYFIARPVRNAAARLVGAIAVRAELSALKYDWARANEMVYVIDRDGIVIMSSDPGWRFMTTSPASSDRQRQIARDAQV